MKLTTSIFFSCILKFALAQNLVLNPSFEEYISCPESIGQFNYSVKDWSTPNFSSTDYFNTCSEGVGAINYNGQQTPRTGKGYSGIYVYSDKNYREYIQGELSQTLEKGKTYLVSFFISLADESSYALNDINILFSEEKLKVSFKSSNIEKTIKPKKITNKAFELFSNSVKQFYNKKEDWTRVSFEFTSKGYENYFSIGNFSNNLKTRKQTVLSQSPYYFSYYYIDDVSVELAEKEHIITTDLISETPKIKPNEIYTFKSLVFDFDKTELLENSIEELNQLYNYLAENPTLTAEIYGHTDTIGSGSRNRELSEQRARAVADYLILKGLNKSRITSFGLGSSQPISSNKTEAGRQENRRVEFKLIMN
ncbi:OmpA family protein [Psychroserpens sp.]|uniref:OmpA family protein n=1 Tax=Psychroserpens sp. TaxID=2020870 RepID=UPI003858732E